MIYIIWQVRSRTRSTTWSLPLPQRLGHTKSYAHVQEVTVSLPACIAGVCTLQQPASVATRNRQHIMSCSSALTSDRLKVHKWTSQTQTQKQWHGYVSSKTLCSGRSYEIRRRFGNWYLEHTLSVKRNLSFLQSDAH